MSDRQQRIKLVEECFSEWDSVPSGVPQGTKLGPWLFVIIINDLNIKNASLWKYVDDRTVSETIPKGAISYAQLVVDEVVEWSRLNRFQLNTDKCKELLWRGILDKIVIRSCAVRHYIVLHNYVAGDTISYPICCLIVMAMPLCRTTCCYIVPDNAIS